MISIATKVLTAICALFWAISPIHGFAPQPSHLTRAASAGRGRELSSTSTTLSASKDADMTEEEREIAMEKALKAMTAFSNKYTQNTNTYYCSDTSIPAVVIKGLAEHKVTLGTPLCPCRFYEDKEKEAKEGYWNCPCVPMRERHECHCMLFLTEDNDFAGDETNISFEEVKKKCGGFS
mmetsp:Transcript_31065/g.53100  ORF Transcript_31065/g.53100 Transcript_31065/m.53100 type:complete len:179 (+) Transcript_31065:160-696(+)